MPWLELAVEEGPNDAAAWSDLAAARLELYRRQGDARALFLGLGAVLRALHLAPDLAEARYNHALLLDRLAMPRRAQDASQVFLDQETEGERAARAYARSISGDPPPPALSVALQIDRFRQALLQGQDERAREAVRRSPWRFRQYAEEAALPGWARAFLAGDLPSQTEYRSQLEIIHAEIQVRGSTLETVSEALAWADSGDPRLLDLARGLAFFGEGVGLIEQGRFERALQVLSQAEASWADLDTPIRHWSKLRQAICRVQSQEPETALPLLSELRAVAVEREDPLLLGRVLVLRSFALQVGSDPSSALKDSAQAIPLLRRAGEHHQAFRAMAMHASSLDALGRRGEAWSWILEAIRSGGEIEEFVPGGLLSLNGAQLALKEGDYPLALFFQDQLLRVVRGTTRQSAVPATLAGRAEILLELDRHSEAVGDLSEARDLLTEVEDPDQRSLLEGAIAAAESRLLQRTHPAEALPKLDEAIRAQRATSDDFALNRSLVARGEVRLGLGLISGAEDDLREAISRFETQRASITEARGRVTYFDQKRAVLDAMVALQFDEREDPGAALAFSERSKARVLEDWLHDGAALSFEAAKSRPTFGPAGNGSFDATHWARRELRPGQVALSFAVLEDRTLAWLLRSEEPLRAVEIDLGAETLEHLVSTVGRSIERGLRDEAGSWLERLSRGLLGPLEAELRVGEELILVPDGALHAVPFALLRKPGSGRLMLEDHLWTVSPSLTAHAASVERGARAETSNPRLLLVTQPRYDSEGKLSSGAREARIARDFDDPLVLSGPAATRGRFQSEIGRFDLVYFGGHSEMSPTDPLLSKLLFASAPGSPQGGPLHARDLLALDLHRAPLVILASCRSAGGRISGTEGVQSLTRPFLAAGASAVVAAHWKVDDEETAFFFVRFFHHLQALGTAGAALRATQLELLQRAPGSFGTWGAFELFGASPVGYFASSPRS